jgi:hypothetical protein
MSAIIDQFENLNVSSRRYFKTPMNGNETNKGKKYRRGKQYAKYVENERLNEIKREQRKRSKVRYDTIRRYEMSTDEDMKLEDLHYANFLGDKYGDNNAPYQKSSVKLCFCDSMCDYEESYQRAIEEHAREEETKNAMLYEMYNKARLEQERQEDEEYETYMRQEEDQTKDCCIYALMREGNFNYDEAIKVVEFLFKERYTEEFKDAVWLPWLTRFGITPRDLYGESYYNVV